ncbi:hypothetical protein [uncultured Roseobacter sp.]|uniref:hypothetical protein n=1 Tax=uncultured Roseobacter sp. TaxID=114847 RepID=UPI0026028A78|nr:hypothetical protein [uncultured Roseobacter sp.]
MMSRGLPLLGSLTIWALAAALGWQVLQARQSPLPDPLRPAPTAQRSSAGTDLQAPAPAQTRDLSELLARPLFASNRRPLATEPMIESTQEFQPIAENSTSDTLPAVIVYGVALNGQHNKALLSINDSVPDWYREKDIIAGWTLSKIENNGVLLQSETSELRIELY